MAKENVTDDLRAELKTLADTLEEVLNSSADKSKEEMGKLRSKAESALKESRARLGETSEAILRQTRETAARADDYVRENPWTGVGIGAAVGLVLVIWAVDAQYRLHVMIATTVVLLLAAAIVGILTLRKARRSTLLRLTRKELENDRALLEEDKS